MQPNFTFGSFPSTLQQPDNPTTWAKTLKLLQWLQLGYQSSHGKPKLHISGFANNVIRSLPIFGLVARILSDEGGVGGDIIDFAEFRRRAGKKCTITDSTFFYEFQDRRDRAGDPLYVLLCCWLAAVGAGLLKPEEMLEEVARLRLSNDIEFEEQNFIAMMSEARQFSSSHFSHLNCSRRLA